MAPVLVLVLCWAGLAAAQFRFPDNASDTPTLSSSTATTTKAPLHHPTVTQVSTPAKPGNTRFVPVDFLGLFTDQHCQRCSVSDQALAHRCCESSRTCCSFILPNNRPISPLGPGIQTFPGQLQGHIPGQFPGHIPGHFPGNAPGHIPGHFPGQFTGQFPGHIPGHFPGHLRPPAVPGPLRGKIGTCPLTAGVHTSFNKFGGGACVNECQNDFHCPTLQKCCPAGCSFVCSNPQEAFHLTSKPGLCPRPGFHFRSGGGGSSQASVVSTTISPEKEARVLEQQDEKERRLSRKERQDERNRSRRSTSIEEENDEHEEIVNPLKQDRITRSANRKDRDDRRERLLNRWSRTRDRVTRSANRKDRDDRRERLLNRWSRTRDRITRSANRKDRDDRRERLLNRWSRTRDRVTRSANRKDRDDRRERLLNRWSRTRDRVTRSAEATEDDHNKGEHQTTSNKGVATRVTRQAAQNQRFFFGDPFCRPECFNDFDCPGNLKCCFQDKDCRQCFNPTFS